MPSPSAHPTAEQLEQVPLLQGFSGEELRRLARHLRVREVASGEVVVRIGQRARWFALIGSGTVQVAARGAPVAWLHVHDFFGEIGLLGDRRRTATVTALSTCTLWEMDRRTFTRLARDHPEVAAAVTAAAQRRRAQDDGFLARAPAPPLRPSRRG